MLEEIMLIAIIVFLGVFLICSLIAGKDAEEEWYFEENRKKRK